MKADMLNKMDEAKEQRDREKLDTATLAKAVLSDLEWLQDCMPDYYSEQEGLEEALKNQREIVRRLRER